MRGVCVTLLAVRLAGVDGHQHLTKLTLSWYSSCQDESATGTKGALMSEVHQMATTLSLSPPPLLLHTHSSLLHTHTCLSITHTPLSHTHTSLSHTHTHLSLTPLTHTHCSLTHTALSIGGGADGDTGRSGTAFGYG